MSMINTEPWRLVTPFDNQQQRFWPKTVYSANEYMDDPEAPTADDFKQAIETALSLASTSGVSNTVTVLPGTYDVKNMSLTSAHDNTVLDLRGVTLRRSAASTPGGQGTIHMAGCTDITVIGGTFDDDGTQQLRHLYVTDGTRITLIDQHVKLNGATWATWFLNTDFLTIRGYRQTANTKSNNDGLHLGGCRYVTIANSQIFSEDDCIAIEHSGSNATQASEDIEIVNTVCDSVSGRALWVMVEDDAEQPIRRLAVTNLSGKSGTVGAGVAIENRGSTLGNIQEVDLTNVTVNCVDGTGSTTDGLEIEKVDGIRLTNVTVKNTDRHGINIHSGSARVSLTNVHVHNTGTGGNGIVIDDSDYVLMIGCHVTSTTLHGLSIVNADNARVIGCSFRTITGSAMVLTASTYNTFIGCDTANVTGRSINELTTSDWNFWSHCRLLSTTNPALVGSNSSVHHNRGNNTNLPDYAVTAGYTVDRAFNPESTTQLEIGRVLGTLIDDLTKMGLLR